MTGYQVHPDTGISSKDMGIMNSFVHNIYERIATKASRFAHCNKKSTIVSRELQTRPNQAACARWTGQTPRESEGIKAVTKYTSSK